MKFEEPEAPLSYRMHSIGSWISHETGRDAGKLELFLRAVYDRYLARFVDPKICAVFGHKMKIADDGDAENGPPLKAYIYCTRCGKE